jgi:hypothetical protein
MIVSELNTDNFKVKIYTLFLIIPIINVIANITTNYFPSGTINPGLFRTLFMVWVILILLTKFKIAFKSIVVSVLLYLLYHFILISFNQEYVYSLTNYIKLSIPFLTLLLGYTIFNTVEKNQQLFKMYVISLGILCLNYIFANIFNLGGSTYLEDSFYLGGASYGLTNEMAVMILVSLTFLLISNDRKWNIFGIVVVVVSLIVIFLVLRRGAILTLAAGLVTFVFFFGFNKKFFKYTVFGAIGLIVLFPIYSNTLISRFEYRVESRGGSLTNYEIEGRYLEIYRVANDIETKGIKMALFGTHNLNSGNYFGGRELHVGYIALLHGSGIIGLGWFFLILFQLVRKQYKYHKQLKTIVHFRFLNGLFWGLLISLLVYLVTSRLHSFSVNIPVFMMLGSILGTMKNEYQSRIQKL